MDGPITSAGVTPSMVSGLPALPSATIRPSRTPTSALTTPQWSSTTAPVITRSGVPSARVATRLAHRLADHLAAAEHGLVAGAARAAAAVLGDLDQQVGVGQPDPVAGGRAVQGGVARAGEMLSHRAARPTRRAVPARPARRPSATSATVRATARARTAPRCRPGCRGGSPRGRRPVEGQRRVGLRRSGSASRPGSAGRRCSRRSASTRRAAGVELDRRRPAVMTSPGIIEPSDRPVHGDQLGAVGEGRLDLHRVQHLGHAVHDVVAGEHRAAGATSARRRCGRPGRPRARTR